MSSAPGLIGWTVHALIAPLSLVRFSPYNEIVQPACSKLRRALTLLIASPERFCGNDGASRALLCWKPSRAAPCQAAKAGKRYSVEPLIVVVGTLSTLDPLTMPVPGTSAE